MKKIYIHLFVICVLSYNLFADITEVGTDKNYRLDTLNVLGNKETNSTALSKTQISESSIQEKQIQNVRNISSIVPNLFIPEYGSNMSNAVYIRGMGSRSSGQTVAVYVDNVPIIDRAGYNFNFVDVEQIEVLRGSQATLFGRNAMGGVINVKTRSPLASQGTTLNLSYGGYNNINAAGTHFGLFSDSIGYGVSLYYNRMGGFFTNTFNNTMADASDVLGGRFKVDAILSNEVFSSTIISCENTDQTAFPYFQILDGEDSPIHYNDINNYKQRNIIISELLEKHYDSFVISSVTAFTNYFDDMWLDQDFTADSIFTLHQTQRRSAITEEIMLKNKDAHAKYNWLVGAFGFYDFYEPFADVLFKREGIEQLIEKNVTDNVPSYVIYDILDTNFNILNDFNNPTFGLAIYHQGTLSLSDQTALTLGLRLDYERASLSYSARTALTQEYSVSQGPFLITDSIFCPIDYDGEQSRSFVHLLPKLAISYDALQNLHLYGSISTGFKSGGYNIQMLSDVLQNDLRADMVERMKTSIYDKLSEIPNMPPAIIDLIVSKIPNYQKINTSDDAVPNALWYAPEYSWNFELGTHYSLFNKKVQIEATGFFNTISELQLTKFSPNGFGRMLSNAGSATNTGVELFLQYLPISNLVLSLNYGLAISKFSDYKDTIKVDTSFVEVDYSGKYVPFAPKNTFSISVAYSEILHNFILDKIGASATYQAAGPIYWNEDNSSMQKLFHTINAKLAFDIDIYTFELWAKNITNSKEHTFQFESLGKTFAQMNHPFYFGGSIKIRF